jgi:E3 ubiquitin-protein ligase HERC3
MQRWRDLHSAVVSQLLAIVAGCAHPQTSATKSSQQPTKKGAAEVASATHEINGQALPRKCDKVAQVSAGESFTCARFASGRVVCWGANEAGELGQGDRESRGRGEERLASIPPISFGGELASSIVSAGAHSCILTTTGKVSCWGANDFGVLGSGDASHRGDEAGEMGASLSFVPFGARVRAKELASGAAHVCALLDDGSVKCWGWNDDGQLGQGDRVSRGSNLKDLGDALKPISLGIARTAKRLVSGARHTCVILDDDSVKCWGENRSGQLGLEDKESRGDAPSEMGDALPRVDLGTRRTALGLAAGDQHTCALLDTHAVKCWGGGLAGALGHGDTVTVGDEPGEMGDHLPPTELGAQSRPEALIAAGFRTCALFADGSLKCWGSNSFGVLGLGDTDDRGAKKNEMGASLPRIDLGNERRATSVALGTLHTCVVLDDGSSKCWGYGKDGVLGYGDGLNRGGKPGDMGDRLPALDLGNTCR